MKYLVIGILIGIVLCVSFFEVIHRSVEVDGWKTCSMIYDKLTEKWHPGFVYQMKVVYKFFALPVKTIWISLSGDELATARGLGDDVCYGDWKFKILK